MPVALTLPLALGGEAAGGIGDAAIAVLSVVSILGGYLLLAALWYFVFRDRDNETQKTSMPQAAGRSGASEHRDAG